MHHGTTETEPRRFAQRAVQIGALALIAVLVAASPTSARVLTVKSKRGTALISQTSDVEHNAFAVRSVRACDTNRDGQSVFAIVTDRFGNGFGSSQDANGSHNRCGDRVRIRTAVPTLIVSVCSSPGPGHRVRGCVSSTVRNH